MPRITFLYSYFFLLQRTYPLAQLSLELGNSPNILPAALPVSVVRWLQDHTHFLKHMPW